jgi:hypothetical protein
MTHRQRSGSRRHRRPGGWTASRAISSVRTVFGTTPWLEPDGLWPDAGEKLLAMRLLNASRFHPLLMDRLARLASDAKLRRQLLQALDTLEKSKDFGELPALFATRPGDAKELAYLNDALATSLDQLIRDASPDARLLLWMIAVANEPVTLALLKGVWSGEDGAQQAQFRQIKQDLDMMPLLPAELQEKLKAMSPKFRAMLGALPPEPLALRNCALAAPSRQRRAGHGGTHRAGR